MCNSAGEPAVADVGLVSVSTKTIELGTRLASFFRK
jgi:hypothetical protein